MRLRPLIFALICLLVTGLTEVSAKGSARHAAIKTLIVTGQNNHNWPVSHRAIGLILENSGLFDVYFAVSPPKSADMSAFKPRFDDFELVVLDYNGDDWSAETKEAFLEYVEGGGGVVVYHAANNAFPDWAEYNKITALGGWGNRNENSGPYIYVVDGKIVKDTSAGHGGSHGSQHEYTIDAFDTKHPVSKGLPKRWKHALDELYDSMRGPGNIATLLYTAYSSPEKGGTDRAEPLIFTVDYDSARIFHTMLGHAGPSLEDNPAMQSTDFQVTLLRGAEWAATGKVTQKVPKDFPTETEISYRLNYKPNKTTTK